MVGWGGAEQDVVGQRLVKDGAAGAAEGRAPAMAADALVRESAVQRAPRRQVPVERELGVHTGERGEQTSEGWKPGAPLTRAGPEPALRASLSCPQEGAGLWPSDVVLGTRVTEANTQRLPVVIGFGCFPPLTFCEVLPGIRHAQLY